MCQGLGATTEECAWRLGVVRAAKDPRGVPLDTCLFTAPALHVFTQTDGYLVCLQNNPVFTFEYKIFCSFAPFTF